MRAMAKRAGLVVIASALAGPALAHTGVGAVHGFGAGLLHPLFGLDHVLAMVAVGLWAGLTGGRARLAYPLAFVGMMVLSGLWGMSGAALPGVEIGIAVSVVVLGLAIALRATPPLAAGAAACAIFAIFHGHAHGAELPQGSSGLGYALGFVLATAALHGAGLALAGLLAARAPLLARVAGGGLALAGVAILAS
ncbi:HupE/UreJ family protein [Bosea sp. (in: a-proteobacteria)]|uniref:HupE/UreJ family protein n=1 Tax=Bosea sp. (in: a-proteobacteria) TaxID=1871050 RepID=UPI002B46591B|nr:HupE/UreJ family protein [Bosea sp. (in: a-proteobacteria)]WRH58256.1 MAG: HupE/UreJ family protein [Bosea sp. (in: a-proteobacteria)]